MTQADPKPQSALDARFEAQRIAFGPIAFQTARCLRDMGILEALQQSGRKGLDTERIAAQCNVPHYGVTVLLEGGLSFGLVDLNNNRWKITKTGVFILRDEMTRVNMDFVHDVNYQGMFHLDEAVRKRRPEGLKVFGTWKTIYEALGKLPKKVRQSWFAFDHFYSDSAFPEALKYVFATPPKRLMDIGGNTGKWAIQCAAHHADVALTIVDLQGQLTTAEENLQAHGVRERVDLQPLDLLNHSLPYPKGHDAIWMSQFLVCFAQPDIIELLRRAAAAIEPLGHIYIMDTYWDRQAHPIATYCLHATSLYFTCLANGTSRMYHSSTMIECIQAAGLRIEEDIDSIGVGHTLFKCSLIDQS